MDYTLLIQQLGAVAAGLTGLYLVFQKYLVVRAKDETAKAGESATTAHFQSLHDAIATMRIEHNLLREEFAKMDSKLHKQQRTITRMEMLLRQFSGLVQQHGISVPGYMERELKDLIVDNELLSKKDEPQ